MHLHVTFNSYLWSYTVQNTVGLINARILSISFACNKCGSVHETSVGYRGSKSFNITENHTGLSEGRLATRSHKDTRGMTYDH